MKFDMEVDAEQMISQLQILGQERQLQLYNNEAEPAAGFNSRNETATCIATMMPGTKTTSYDGAGLGNEEKSHLDISVMTESVEGENAAVDVRPRGFLIGDDDDNENFNDQMVAE